MRWQRVAAMMIAFAIGLTILALAVLLWTMAIRVASGC